MIHQLRIYQINPSLKNEFDMRFKDHAARIMKSYDFKIVSVWYSESDKRTEFIYILEWQNIATMSGQWDAFMADAEWSEIKRASREAHGEMVLAKVCDQILEDTNWFVNPSYI